MTAAVPNFGMGFGVSGAEDVARALQGVTGQLAQLTTRQNQNTQSTRAMAQASTQTTQSFGQMVQQGQQVTQRIQGVAGAVQALVSQMGSHDRTSGMIASVAGATAQFATMGSMLGPAGTVVGGLAGLVVGLRSVVSANDDVARTAREAQEALATLAQRRISDRGTAEFGAEISGGAISNRRTDADIELAAEERRIRREGLNAEFAEARANRARIDEAYSGSSTDAAERARENAERVFNARRDALSREYNALGDEVDTLEGELGRREAVARERGRAAAEEGANRTRHSGVGGRPRSPAPAPDEALGRMSAETEGDLFSLSGFNMESFLREDAAATIAENQRAAEEAAAAIAMIREAESDAMDQATAKAREMRDAQRELNEAAREGALAFSEGYVNSLEAVADAYRQANNAAKDAGRGMISSGRLMERSLVAVGNNIAETFGETMVGAFEKALGAWLEGSKSFVEAAEEMVKGALKALVIESIVQAVAETARGIAGVASSYGADPTAYQHFAAAAAWAAVGVAAGGVGAGIGAFGGGGGGGGTHGAPTSRELAGSGGSERGGDTYNIEVYPGGFITSDEVAGGIVEGLNRAARNGRTIDSRLVRR